MDREELEKEFKKVQVELSKTQALLEQMRQPPLEYATVVSVGGESVERPECKPQKASYRTLRKVGSRVRIRKDSEYCGQSHAVGSVRKEIQLGWVKVDFDDGVSANYRVGCPEVDHGICDLEFAEGESKKSTAVISTGGGALEVLVPNDIQVQAGDIVKVFPPTKQIVDVARSFKFGGDIGYVRRVINEQLSEIDYNSSKRVVFNGRHHNLAKGDHVVLDSNGMVVMQNLGKGDESFDFSGETHVSWTDIGGLEEAKRQMIEAVEMPHTNPEIYKFYGKSPTKGVLLFGPPGCGKTMLGKAAATALTKIYGGVAKASGFIYVKGPEILDRYVGVAEATVRSLFQRAACHKQEHGYPAVMFIDEADAILSKRGTGVSSDMERTIVPMFLAEMDGLEASGAMILLATNRPDVLDPAVVREGRIDRKIHVTRPTRESAMDILLMNMRGIPLHNGHTHEELAALGSEEIFKKTRVLYHINTKSRGRWEFTLGDIVSGGMVANVVDQATSIAMNRDLAEGHKGGRGLVKEDLVAAVDAVERQNHSLNHKDELEAFTHDFKEDIVGIHRLKAAVA